MGASLNDTMPRESVDSFTASAVCYVFSARHHSRHLQPPSRWLDSQHRRPLDYLNRTCGP